ncbi:hypothetical protein BDZ97DRAFT_1329485 [Flammula alnicola]|nr:hypothetical protein BDZ97DRAFT_1329485 [Flammula alnicola]
MAVAILPPQSYIAWKVSMTILHSLGFVATVFRLVHRFRINRLWWDDYVVFFPFAIDIAYAILPWFRFTHRITDLTTASRTLKILSTVWLSLFPYLLIVWATKIALALSLGRIFPSQHPARLWSFFLVVIMVICCISLILISALTCTYTSSLMTLYDISHCVTGIGGFPLQTILIIVESMLCDVLLFISPLVLFWRVKLPPRERHLILTVFCGNILTTMSEAAIAIIFLNNKISPGEDYVLILVGLCNIEAAISLFVCNLPVVTTCLYQALRRLRHREGSSLESTEGTSPSRSPCSCFPDHNDGASTMEPLTFTEIDSSFSLSNSQSRSQQSLNLSDETSRAAYLSSSISEKSELRT